MPVRHEGILYKIQFQVVATWEEHRLLLFVASQMRLLEYFNETTN